MHCLTKCALCRGGGDPSDQGRQRFLLERLVRWVLDEEAVPLVRQCFYATERESKSAVVAYFRKPVWAAIRSRAVAECLPQYSPLVGELRRKALARSATLGVCPVRLLPKSSNTSVRAIANLSKRLRGHGGGLSTNNKLTALYHVLKYSVDQQEKEAHGEAGLLGFAVKGLDEIHDKLRAFKLAGLVGPAPPGKPPGGTPAPRLCFASLDLEQCYDRVDQSALFDLAASLIDKEYYLVAKTTLAKPLATSATKERIKVGLPGCRAEQARGQTLTGS